MTSTRTNDPIEEVCGKPAGEILARCAQRQPPTDPPVRLTDLAGASRERFLHLAHHALLARPPSPIELTRREARLRAGGTRIEIILRLAASAEGRNVASPPVTGTVLPALTKLLRAATRVARASGLASILRRT
jgi:hypothetical protein